MTCERERAACCETQTNRKAAPVTRETRHGVLDKINSSIQQERLTRKHTRSRIENSKVHNASGPGQSGKVSGSSSHRVRERGPSKPNCCIAPGRMSGACPKRWVTSHREIVAASRPSRRACVVVRGCDATWVWACRGVRALPRAGGRVEARLPCARADAGKTCGGAPGAKVCVGAPGRR